MSAYRVRASTELQKAHRDAAQKIYSDLWLYCQRDTEAMVALLRRLEAEGE